MELKHVEVYFQIVAFLFAISFHESAHALIASRCGDPTARLLGRITLNPLRHIDPIGTVLMPLLAAISGVPLIGWAKPVPVNPLHFRRIRRDDILVSMAGPASNMILACLSLVVLAVFRAIAGVPLMELAEGSTGSSFWQPLVLMFLALLKVNLVLACFNLIPIPPLDGSHVMRHLLPEGMQDAYDRFGMFGLPLLMLLGGRILSVLLMPVQTVFYGILSQM